MPPDERLRPHTDRLARLLASPQGSEILMEIQKLGRRGQRQAEPPAAGGRDIGVWRVEGDALHRRDGCAAPDWANVEYVPPAGDARRLVLLGESAARGWPYDPDFNCAIALQRHLDQVKPDGYQCVDLAKIRANAADLVTLADQLPRLRPDVVVAFAGNNWAVPPGEIEFRTSPVDEIEVQNALAQAVRERGYVGMRDYLATITLARGRQFLDRLAALEDSHGAQIVIVIPEFNLRYWTPPADIETPVLAPAALARWYELYAAATRAHDERRWVDVAPITGEMRDLDGGNSPVPGYLAGVAAEALGDGAAARAALEDSRDSLAGLLVNCVPRVTRPIQRLLASYAAQRGWACVDLRSVLAAPERPELPDQRFFHDYCHLSDVGIERAMAAVADAVGGRAPGTTRPGPGVSIPSRAFAHAHAATHLAFTGQPPAVVRSHLRAAVEGDPDLVPALTALRDLLSAPYPRWTHPAAQRFADYPGTLGFLITFIQTGGGLPAGLWTLRECLGEVVGAETTGDSTAAMDLLDGPHCGGQALPNWTPARCHHKATAHRSSFAFGLDRPRGGVIDLTYRMPAAAEDSAAAEVFFNGTTIAALPARTRWTGTAVPFTPGAARRGTNHLDIRWPVPAPDVDALHAADALALARGQFPYVLPVFGELFEARIRLDRPE